MIDQHENILCSRSLNIDPHRVVSSDLETKASDLCPVLRSTGWALVLFLARRPYCRVAPLAQIL